MHRTNSHSAARTAPTAISATTATASPARTAVRPDHAKPLPAETTIAAATARAVNSHPMPGRSHDSATAATIAAPAVAVIAARGRGAGVASGGPDSGDDDAGDEGSGDDEAGDEGSGEDDAEDDGSGGSLGGGVAVVTGNDIRFPSDAVTRLTDLCLVGGGLSGFESAVWTNNSGQRIGPFLWFEVVQVPDVGTKQPSTRPFDDGR